MPGTGFSHTFVSYGYDAAGHLAEVRDALGEPYRFAYDGHLMVRHTNRTGLSFYYEYQQGSDVAQVVHAWGDGGLYDYRFEYWPAIREVRITDSLGHVSTVQCDERGLPTLEIDPLGGRTAFEYDEVGRTTAVVDAADHRTEYAYDERGNLLKLTRPDGSVIAVEVDAGNKPVAIADPNGAVSRQYWDERGLLRSQTSPLGAVTAYEYSPDGLLLEVTDALQAITRLGYDADGGLTSVTDALGNVSRLLRDELGNVLERSDPLGRKTAYRYDGKGRLVEVALPGGARISYGYDAQDNLVEHQDESGALTRFEYFGQDLMAKRHQPDGHVVAYHYNTEEQLVGVSNQRGETYQLLRDALGRVIQEVDYWGQVTNYRFNAAGHLLQSRDPLGRVIDYTTDKLGQIRRKSLEHPDRPGGRFEETFDFDANGNLTACANEHVKVMRVFDADGRLIEEKQNGFSVKNRFDRPGRHIGRETDGHVVMYGYDALGALSTVRIDDEPPITIERDADGQVLKETLGPALERLYRYDPEGRLAVQGMRRNAEWLFHTQYEYDTAGNLTQRKDSQTGADHYRHDPLGQVVEHMDPQGRLKRFMQDPAGDRLATRVVDSTAQRRSEGGGMRAGSWGREGWHEGIRYRFDRAGNLVERHDPGHPDRPGDAPRTTTLIWDANQRLVRSQTDGAETVYGYDPLGRRVFKRTGAQCIWFGWNGDVLVAQGAGEMPRPAPMPPAHGQLVGLPARWAAMHQPPAWQPEREYVYYPDAFVPLAMLSDGCSYRYYNDPNGCPTRLTRVDGEVVWAARYEVWGRARVLINEVNNPLRLQGQYEDGETGLHYNRHRYCDPVAGQFISLDPLGLAAGENLSNYAPNTTEWTDPLGLWGTGAAPRYRHGPNGELRSAFAQIRPQDLNTGTRTNGSSRARAQSLGCRYDDAGHPIGFQLGGHGGVNEIFSQNRGINRGRFAQFESDIAARVRAGDTVFVRITPQYLPGSTRPHEIVYSVRVNGRTTVTRFANPPRFPNCGCGGTH